MNNSNTSKNIVTKYVNTTNKKVDLNLLLKKPFLNEILYNRFHQFVMPYISPIGHV